MVVIVLFASSTMSHNNVPEELRCTYRSKPCPNERARKRNGTPHKLCQEHRIKANQNQRNMARRQRARREKEHKPDASDELLNRLLFEEDRDLDDDADVDEWGLLAIEPLDGPVELKPEDLEALQVLWDKQFGS